ncbi:MAG TPA: sulfur carrier protein ThiS, partial [Phycisphaerae bacterium]|nr:sulfur carrier protein ThiS [Phycisphaerae bacterium]
MRVCINGQWQDRTESTVAELLSALRFEPRRCAVERNRRIVPRARHAETG